MVLTVGGPIMVSLYGPALTHQLSLQTLLSKSARDVVEQAAHPCRLPILWVAKALRSRENTGR